VAEAVASDYANLYVVNKDDNTIVQFLIGKDGKVYPQQTVNTPGIYPLAVAVNGVNLFVLDTYQPLTTCSTASPCSGSIAVYPLVSGALGTPVTNTSNSATYWPLTVSGSSDIILPTGVNVLASGAYVYVSAYDTTAATGYVFGFKVGSDGTLTAVSGSPFAVGTHPSALASDPSNSYVYVTDYSSGKVFEYSVASGTGVLTALDTIASGSNPSAIVADPLSSYPYVYVANATDGTVTAYSIGTGGALIRLGTFSAGTQPVAIGIDPSTNHFLYAANYLGSSVSGFEIVTTGTSVGSLVNSQDSPYTASAYPTAVAAVPHN
jgi:6-phosphogluconolactonase (cycloisomerase 2 family)